MPDSSRSDPRRPGKSIAESLKENVRNGFVHHARINRRAQFSMELERPVALIKEVLIHLGELLGAALIKAGRVSANRGSPRVHR